MSNDLFLIFIGPVLVCAAVGVAWLIERYWGECRHEWSEWQSELTDHAYVQHKECIKCKYVFTYQLRKMGPTKDES